MYETDTESRPLSEKKTSEIRKYKKAAGNLKNER